jgi:hypothetical protein
MQAGTPEAASATPPIERIRSIDSEGVGLDPWRPLHPGCAGIAIQQRADDAMMRRVAELWNGRPDVELRFLGYSVEDLEFLRDFPGLEKLNLQVPIIKDIAGLRHVTESLKQFTMTSTTVRLSLKPVAACSLLESLHLQNHLKDFDALQSLQRLQYLGIPGISFPDLSKLLPFENLRSLFLGFCKPMDLGMLGQFPKLESIHILKMNNLHDLGGLRFGRTLRRIELAWLPHVARLPVLSELERLDEFEVDGMKSLNDITAIAAAPALRYLALWDCKSLKPDSFKCLIGHPTLKHINFGIGRLKDNEAVAAMFPPAMTETVN